LLSFLGAVLLLALNRDLYRILEGYGGINPLRVLLPLARRDFQRLRHERSRLEADYRSHVAGKTDPPPDLLIRRARIIETLALRFPDESRWILPTAFGNTIRAFEVYPRVMYGLESTVGWNRLLAVVPKDYRQLIDSARAQTDLWVNVCFLSLVFAVEYVVLVFVVVGINHASQATTWSLVAALTLVPVAVDRARHAAEEWGDLFKASFDVFLPDLAKKMGFALDTGEPEDERRIWGRFSQAITYGLPQPLPGRMGLKRGNQP
jgi:hypothetical protein